MQEKFWAGTLLDKNTAEDSGLSMRQKEGARGALHGVPKPPAEGAVVHPGPSEVTSGIPPVEAVEFAFCFCSLPLAILMQNAILRRGLTAY